VSNGLVVVRELSVPVAGLPTGLDGLRIAHVSDFHFRRWDAVTQAAQSLLLTLDYDLLAVTGDLGNFRWYWRKPADLARRFFEPLAERGTIFAVLGNHDHPRLADADLPLRFLRNESVNLDFFGAKLRLAGLDQSRRRAENLDAVLDNRFSYEPTILLAHYPSTVFRLPIRSVQFVLSGHTHGGQIRLPGLGCLWTNDRIPRRISRGLHHVAGTTIHVSAGIGVSLPLRIRWNCPAEVTVLGLVASHRTGDAPRSATKGRKPELVPESIV
jgi:predicted MPP superfamily phosphohydrolase